MTFAGPLRDLGRSDLQAEADEQRARMIRDGRAWLETHMDDRAPWGFDDECCFNTAQMLNAGRDGIDVINYVNSCNQPHQDAMPAGDTSA
jgi:hypothetical protein